MAKNNRELALTQLAAGVEALEVAADPKHMDQRLLHAQLAQAHGLLALVYVLVDIERVLAEDRR